MNRHWDPFYLRHSHIEWGSRRAKTRSQLCCYVKYKCKVSLKLLLNSIWPEERRIARTMSYKVSIFLEAFQGNYMLNEQWQMRNQIPTLILVGLLPVPTNETFWKNWIGVYELDSIFLNNAHYLKLQILSKAGCQIPSDQSSWAPKKGNQESKVDGLPWGVERRGSRMHLSDLSLSHNPFRGHREICPISLQSTFCWHVRLI